MTDPSTTIQAASDTVNSLSLFIDSVSSFFPKFVMFCAYMAAFFPRPDPSSIFYSALSPLRKLIDFIGGNFGHAKNEKRCD